MTILYLITLVCIKTEPKNNFKACVKKYNECVVSETDKNKVIDFKDALVMCMVKK